MNIDTKIKVSVGCVEYLKNEVEKLRKHNHEMGIENKIIHRFLSVMESVSPRGNLVSYGEDKMWEAKKEIAEAINEAKKFELKPSSV